MEYDRKIGIIGGMGPAATWLFYRYVTEMTEASCDQDHVNMVILSDAAMPDRTAAILSGKEEPVMKKMREDVKTLVGCGCEAVAVTCNTAHFFMEKVAKETQVPLIHMPEETAKEAVCQAAGGKSQFWLPAEQSRPDCIRSVLNHTVVIRLSLLKKLKRLS